MRVRYVDKKFSARSEAIIHAANLIVEEYAAQGFSLTLRQLYYQFVARDLIENSQRSYKRLGSVINDARMAGRMSWLAIEDRTRWLRQQARWKSPAEIVRAAAESYHIDMWVGQPRRVEVWIEKDALVGVVEGVCEEYDVPFFACRGYPSQSEVWRAARRFDDYFSDHGQDTIVLHLGDHDPSGIDMTRDIEDRLYTFADPGPMIHVRRIALNMPQIEEYGPPPNPAKVSDSRAPGYIARHGRESWELDALEPSVITALIRGHVESEIDGDAWRERAELLEQHRAELDEVVEQLGDDHDDE